MWSGYSFYQLVFGQNPNILGVMIDKPSALKDSSRSKAFAKHMNTLCAARQGFVESEFSEKVGRALRHKIRVSSEEFKPGDKCIIREKCLINGRDQGL